MFYKIGYIINEAGRNVFSSTKSHFHLNSDFYQIAHV